MISFQMLLEIHGLLLPVSFFYPFLPDDSFMMFKVQQKYKSREKNLATIDALNSVAGSVVG